VIRQSDLWAVCSIPGCKRPNQAEGKFSAGACRYHIQHKARHGSHWYGTYRASDLKPYIQSARKWVNANSSHGEVVIARLWLRGLLEGAGRVELAHRIKGQSATRRAKFAFARLREAGIEPDRILSIYLAVCALIEDDRGSHRVEEFRVVQVAKAVHRLASGSHQRWDFPLANGTTAPLAMHTYPKSSGIVLRIIGRQIEECCRSVAGVAMEDIRSMKRAAYGPHPSELPGWVPEWQRKYLQR
jgi:hypothetical protein